MHNTLFKLVASAATFTVVLDHTCRALQRSVSGNSIFITFDMSLDIFIILVFVIFIWFIWHDLHSLSSIIVLLTSSTMYLFLLVTSREGCIPLMTCILIYALLVVSDTYQALTKETHLWPFYTSLFTFYLTNLDNSFPFLQNRFPAFYHKTDLAKYMMPWQFSKSWGLKYEELAPKMHSRW